MGLYSLILIGWSGIDTVGIDGWTIDGDGIRLSDRGLLFVSDGGFSYALQKVSSVENPRISISLLDRCPDMYVKVLLETFDGGKRQALSARSRDSLKIQALQLRAEGVFDSVRFRISGHSRMDTRCTVPILRMGSNFLQNVDFSKVEVFPSGWGRRNARYSDGAIQFRRNGSIGKYFHMKRGTVYRVGIRGRGNFTLRLHHIATRKSLRLTDSTSLLDTVPAFGGRVFLEVSSNYGILRGVSVEVLDTLPIVLSRVRRRVHLWNNTGKGYRLYVYDSDGNIYGKYHLGDSLTVDFDRKGTYLFLIPKVFRQEVRIR